MSAPAPTRSAASKLNPPANTDSLHSSSRSAFVEKIVAPRHRRLEGLLAWHHPSSAAGQEPEAIIEGGGDVGWRQHAHARSSQLNRQRNAIQATAYATDDVERGPIGRKTAPQLRGALDEQPSGSLVV